MAYKTIAEDVVKVYDVKWCFWRCNFEMSHQCHTKFKGLKALKYVTSLIFREIAGCSAVGSVLRSGRSGRRFESGHPDSHRRPYSRILVKDYYRF